MSRPPKPPSLRSIDGSRHAGKSDGSIRYPILEYVPPPPDWLTNPHAVAEWQRIGPILAKNKLLTEVSLSSLAQYCALHGTMVAAWAAGGSPNAALFAQYRQLGQEFGLTPLSQGRIKAPGEPPATNAFQRNGQRNVA